jgi:hypothetical protein
MKRGWESWLELQLARSRLIANSHRLSCTFINSLVWLWAGPNFNESWWEFSLSRSNIQSTLFNFHATLVLVWLGHESWENSHANSRFSTLINSHAILVLVWPGHESWENSDANTRFSTLMQLSCNSCSRLTSGVARPSFLGGGEANAEGARPSKGVGGHATSGKFWNLESLKCDFKHFGGEILQNSEDYKVHRRHKFSQTFLIFYSEPYLQLL